MGEAIEKPHRGLKKLGVAALLIVGVADLALINLVLAPKVFGPEAFVADASSARLPDVALPTELNSDPPSAARRDSPDAPVPSASEALLLPPAADAARPEPTAPVEASAETTQPPVAVPATTVWRVHFNTASTNVNAPDRRVLQEVVAAWKRSGGQTVQVVGHADQRGEHAHNSVLSRQRAESIAAQLQVMGIPLDKLSISARGDTELLDTNHSIDALAANRRVEITFR